MTLKHHLAIGALALAPLLTHAADWPNWRGPNHDGSSPETGLPTTFSKTEGVRWAVDMPGASAATPVVWGDKVFVSSTDENRQHLLALCLNRETGDVIWQKDIGPRIKQDDRSNFASPSPVTDGERVYFFYGNGDLIAFDMAGETVWRKNLQEEYGDFAFLWTFSTSPLLHDGRLIMQVLQRDEPVQGRGKPDAESYIVALDPKTGEELWRQVRPAKARSESLEAFSTPIPFTHDGREEIIVAGGDCITGHDPDTGRELWRWGTWNPNRITHWRLVTSPVAGGGVVLASAPKGDPIYAVKAGQSGTLSNDALAWVSEDRAVSTDVATPLFYKGVFFVLNTDRKTLTCLEPASGKIHWTAELPTRTKLEASPTGADGKIYLMDHAGKVFVVKADTAGYELLHETDFGGSGERELRSSIVPAHGNLFIRTNGKLYCIGD